MKYYRSLHNTALYKVEDDKVYVWLTDTYVSGRKFYWSPTIYKSEKDFLKNKILRIVEISKKEAFIEIL